MNFFWLFLFALASVAAPAIADEPALPETLSKDRLILRTTLGDMAFALHDALTPEHANQIRRLAGLGVYDKTFIYLVEPSLFVQVCDAKDKLAALTSEQMAAIKKLNGEFRPEPLHRRGALVMARHPDNPASAETSFMILLRDAPELDGNNTVFGALVQGEKVLDAIAAAPRNDQGRPVKTILIEKMEILESSALELTSASGYTAERLKLKGSVAWNILALAAVIGGIVMHRIRRYAKNRKTRSLAKLGALAGFFYVLCAYTPQAASNVFLGALLFSLTIGLFFWLSRFETD